MAARSAIPVLALIGLTLSGYGRARAQSPRPPRDAVSSPAATGTATIRGRVVAADGGRPLRRVQLRFTAPELAAVPGGRTTSTDEDGRYEMVGLPAARYTVVATRAGFLSLRYGQRRPRELGRLVEVADRQIVERIDFALPKMSVISGRITDEDGEAIAGVLVQAMRMRYFNGRRQLVSTSESNLRTDDVGAYRISNLVPGTYVISARTRDEWTIDAGGHEQTMGYAPTYFPGATNVADARRVTVGIGQEASATDFSLQPARAVTVSGRATDAQGRPFPTVNLNLEIRSENGGMFAGAGNVRTSADGSFTFRDVAPGDYIVTAARQEPDPELASLPIVVDGADLTNLTLTGSSGGTVSGRVVLDEGITTKMPRVRINITGRWLGQPPPAMLGTFRDRYVPAEPDANGTYAIPHVFGPDHIDVTLPEGWMVKSVVHDGRDITDEPIDLRNGQSLSGVQITLTDRLTSITGAVTDNDNAPAVDGTVVIFPTEAGKRFEGSRFVKATRPDQQGRYRITGLPPGDYLAVALAYVEEGTWDEPEYLESLRQRAEPIRLSVDEPQTRALKVLSLP